MTYQDTRQYGPGSRRWQDSANLILAIWLFISPWVLQFAGGANGNSPVAAWNAWVLGVIVFLIALSALGQRFARGHEWYNLILGIWIFIAPWVLGFAAAANPAWDHWIVGALVFLVSASGLSMMRPAMAHDPHHSPLPR